MEKREKAVFDNMLIQRKMFRQLSLRKTVRRVKSREVRETKGKFHIFVRGFASRTLFHSDEERVMFLIIVNEVLEETGSKMFAFILMDNHFHFILESNNLSILMGQILFRYSRWYKRRWPAVVKVFDTPFGSSPIKRPTTFKDTFLYVMSNAKRAKMCFKHQDYFWSSANQYFSTGTHLLDCYIKVDKGYVLEEFGSEYKFSQEVNSYFPFRKDGKRVLRKYVSDNQVAEYFKRLVNNRDIKMIDKASLDCIIKSLRFDCSATYIQISYHIPRSVDYIRKVCKS